VFEGTGMIKGWLASLAGNPCVFWSIVVAHAGATACWVIRWADPRINCKEYFDEPHDCKKDEKDGQKCAALCKEKLWPSRRGSWLELARDIFFNIVGVFVGWVCLFAVVEWWCRGSGVKGLTTGGASLVGLATILALLGITGRLPQAIQRFAEKPGK